MDSASTRARAADAVPEEAHVTAPALSIPSAPAGMRVRAGGPFTRWPRAADAALALVAVTVAVVLPAQPGSGDSGLLRSVAAVPIPALLVFAAAGAAVYWRRRTPLQVLALVLTAWALTLGSAYADLGGLAIIALYSVGRYGTDDRWGHIAVAGTIGVLTLDGLTGPAPWGETGFGAVVMCVAW
jgi:hypothetical protein